MIYFYLRIVLNFLSLLLSYFLEKEAFNENGELIVPKKEAINKIGHCLHMKNEVFKKITFSDKVKELIRQLGYKKPIVPQSMFIFKNSKVGGQVVPHKDSTFLYTEPDLDLVGLWFPMVDVNLENGCLSYVKESHLDSRRKLFVRNGNRSSNDSFNFVNEDQEQIYSEEDFTPIEVKAGSCVLIHGLVVHQSKNNNSDQGRPVYTFHLLDMYNKKWCDQNWLQETNDYKFPLLYETNC